MCGKPQLPLNKNISLLLFFEFSFEDDTKKVLEVSPWSVMDYSMVLKQWEGYCTVDDIIIKV